MTASTDHPDPTPSSIQRRRIQLPQTSTDLGEDDAALARLTVRELIERLARTEEQLNLVRLRNVDRKTRSIAELTRQQHTIIRELRRRRPR